jgi:hypothetical protein
VGGQLTKSWGLDIEFNRPGMCLSSITLLGHIYPYEVHTYLHRLGYDLGKSSMNLLRLDQTLPW